jgi:ATP-dependent exoDNAse (exonuclease V) beta subunit
LAEQIENETVGQEARAAAAREELRLLYVGFTRARDMLVLITRTGKESAWLDLLQAPWFVPLEGTDTTLQGSVGPAQVPCATRIIDRRQPSLPRIQPPVTAILRQ